MKAEREMAYGWHFADGAVDVTAVMRLTLRVSYEPNVFAVTDLISAVCDSVVFNRKPHTKLCDDEQLLAWIARRFVQDYNESKHRIDDYVEGKACEVLGPEMKEMCKCSKH